MKVTNVIGYMLTNGDYSMDRGDQWWSCDAPVWICMNQRVARQIMMQSQQNKNLSPSEMWTHIYRVHGAELNCTKISGQLMYVSDPTNIIVDRLVCYRQAPNLRLTSNAHALRNADIIAPHFFKLMNGTKERVK